MKQGYVYLITSPSGKMYIGQTYCLKKRFIKYANINCHDQGRLYEEIKLYGWENMKIKFLFEGLSSKQLLYDLEKHYIQLYNTFDSIHGLNTQSGGISGFRISKEGKKNLSISHCGYKHTPEQKAKISKSNSGKKRNSSVLYKMKEYSTHNKLVLNLETGIFYVSSSQAAEAHNIKRTTLTAMLTGQNLNRTSLKYI